MFKDTKLMKDLERSGTIIWHRRDNLDTLANGYFLANLDLRQYPKTFGKLVSIIGRIPEDGEEIFYKINSSEEKKGFGGENFLDSIIIEMDDKREIESTGILVEHYSYNMRVFEEIGTRELIVVNDDLAQCVKIKDIEYLETSSITLNGDRVLYIQNPRKQKSGVREEIIILPIKLVTENIKRIKTIQTKLEEMIL